MNLAAERKAIEAALDAYRAELDRLPDDLFGVVPPIGGWSMAEVYAHILQATLGASIALEKCTLSSCPAGKKGLNWLGRLFFLFGRFPPVKVKTPVDAGKSSEENLNKEDARNLIIKCRQRIEKIAPLVHKAAKNRRIAHPLLGLLNAAQWFRFIRIHLQHHLKQLQKIEHSFGN